ncbi:F-box protein CPR1-like [Silene latifolia]|uniref:F-box protein CPR1-like n=1 Tax=Silene latifolia TaxID=37657 RepID=UPI003D7843F5
MTETFKNNVSVYRKASVYSLRNDSWKCVTDQTMMGQFLFVSDMAVCVNEGLHFIVVDTMSNCKLKFKVKCFNLQTETFSIFDLPKLDDMFRKVRCVIGELGGCFSVLVNYENVNRGMGVLVRVDLWVMKEYGNQESWFRLFSITDLAIFPSCAHMRQVVFSKDKRRVLLQLNLSLYGWYSWGSNTFEIITLHGLPYANAACYSWTFLDSLVSLSKIKDKDTDMDNS